MLLEILLCLIGGLIAVWTGYIAGKENGREEYMVFIWRYMTDKTCNGCVDRGHCEDFCYGHCYTIFKEPTEE